MAASLLGRVLGTVGYYAHGLQTYCLLFFLSIRSGSFFRKTSEREANDLAIGMYSCGEPEWKLTDTFAARDELWNLSKSPLPGFSHHFQKLRNGKQLHYISSQPLQPQSGNLVIFIHGFPDSYAMWRPLLSEASMPTSEVTYVAVDMPGFGGSDALDIHDSSVLEALAEFIIAMRDTFLSDGDLKTGGTGEIMQNVYVVAHDWGGVLTNRLASEAPSLADRFIIINGPPADLMFANSRRILESSRKIFKQFQQAPWTNFGCLRKAIHTARPLIRQLLMSGYIFAFNLPKVMVRYLGSGGNLAFMRGVHAIQTREKNSKLFIPEALAATLGPSLNECGTSVSDGVNGSAGAGYSADVKYRAKSPANAFWVMTSFYRDGPASKRWNKSLQLIADLYALDADASESSSPARRRSSSSASSALFTPQIKGMLQAPTTVIWGEEDRALSRALCMDGLSDFLAKDSEVIALPRSGHWTPLEPESRAAIARVVGTYAADRNNELTGRSVLKEVTEVYHDAWQAVKK